MSPEKGIKRLVAEAMKLTSDHVHRFVDEIHMVLMETVKDAARNIMTLEISGGKVQTNKTLEYMRLQGFENAVIIAASEALEDWRSEAHSVASAMVQMECDYVTPSYFRDLERQWQEQAAGSIENGGADVYDGQDESSQSRLTYAAEENSDTDGSQEAVSPRQSRDAPANQKEGEASTRSGEGKAGWLEKRAGDSSNFSSLPVESWRWQKRWFVLELKSGQLFYYPSPEDVNKKQPKVAVNLRDCIVEDYQPEDDVSSKKSSQKSESNAKAGSLLIRLHHKNPSQKIAKHHQSVILKAADASDKYDWLARLRHAAEPKEHKGSNSQGGPGQRLQSPAPRGLMSGASSVDRQNKGLIGRTVDKVSNQFSRITGLGSSKMGDVISVGSIEDLDAYYEKLGMFCGIYARMTYDRMAKTVPKAIILCQVINSRDKLLDQLFHYLSTRTEKEIQFMLQEDPSVSRRRAAASQASKDMGESLEEVRKITDLRNATDSRATEAKVSVRTLLLAGAFPLVPKNLVPPSINPGRIFGEFTPSALVTNGDVKTSLAKPLEAKDEDSSKSKPPTSPKTGTVQPRRQPPPPPPTL